MSKGNQETDPTEDEEDTSAGEDEQEDGGQEPADVNPHVKKLNGEAAKHRKKAKAERKRADAAEAQLHEARLALAFTRANYDRAEPFKDVDMALGLCDLGAVTLGEDGQPLGLTEAMDALADRYPYLVDDTEPASDDDDDEPKPSGRSVRTRPKGSATLNTAAMAKKYPALFGR